MKKIHKLRGEFYLREGDSLNSVYQVNRKTKNIRLFGSSIGTENSFVWPLKDYLPEWFVRCDVFSDGSVKVRK